MTILTIGEVRTATTARMTVRARPGEGSDDVEISTLPGIWTTRAPADLRAAARLMADAADWLDARAKARDDDAQLALNLGLQP